MKNIVLITLTLLFLYSCKETPKNAPVSEAPTEVVSDSAAIANTIHGFFNWYKTYLEDTTKHMDFVDNDGMHYILNQAKFEKYYAPFKESGFVSTEFIEKEYAFYKNCSRLWQNEPIDEVPSCVDGDKYYCAQDWEDAFWISSAVRVKNISADRVLATLHGIYFKEPMERNFELKKENGKWLLTKVECDMGVNF